MAAVEGTTNASFRPSEGETGGANPLSQNPNETVRFNDGFGSEHAAVDDADMARERKSSRDYSATDEWDASKVPPSRFQQRKGSVFATPPSRDGHVQRNRDSDAGFHDAHSKRFSFSKAKDFFIGAIDNAGSKATEGHKRKSSSGSQGNK